jgi:hypothetical protein
MAKSLGLSYKRLVAIQRRADTKFRAQRPVLGDPEGWRRLAAADDTDQKAHALWAIARLEQFALIGVYQHEDVRSSTGRSAARAAERAFWERCRALPRRFYEYGILLWWRLSDRQEANEEPSLSPIDRRRHDQEVRLLELWDDATLLPAFGICRRFYPTKLPLGRAEAHLRWLAAELEQLDARAEARLASA